MIRVISDKLMVKIINLTILLAQYLKLVKNLHLLDQMMKEILLLKNIRMAVDIKVLKVMVWETAKENSFINKVAFMMVNGKTIICMDMENYIIQTIK